MYGAGVLGLGHNGSDIVFFVGPAPNDGLSCDIGSNFFQTGKWHFLLGTYDGDNSGKMRVYIDGKEACPPKDRVGTIVAGKHSLDVGAMNAIGNFTGLIDEVRVYEASIGSAQIQKLYAEGAERHNLSINK